jgi:hypothetical protein
MTDVSGVFGVLAAHLEDFARAGFKPIVIVIIVKDEPTLVGLEPGCIGRPATL